MKRVLFVATNPDSSRELVGGSEHLWVRTLLRMHEKGYTVSANLNPNQAASPQIQAIEAVGCPVTRRTLGRFFQSRRLSLIEHYGGRIRAFWQLHRFKPDLVVISQGGCFDGIWYATKCRELSIPYVVIVQAVDDRVWLTDYGTKDGILMYRGAVASFFLSPSNKALVETQLAVEIPNSRWVQNPYKVNWEARPAWPKTDEFRLACVARLEPASKGQDVLFDVLAQKKWRDRPLKVTLYGSGAQKETLQRLVQLRGLDNVEFGGFVNNIEEIWATHHALILASRSEGLPLALVEAMLCERFAIITNVAGNADMIEDNVSGFLAKGPYIELLDEAMERAWAQRNSWRKIGQAAAKRARSVISKNPIEDYAQALIDLL